MIIFSTVKLMDEQKCYDFLVNILHEDGLCCPACQKKGEKPRIHRRDREPQSYISVVHVDAFTTLFLALCGRELIIAAQ